MRDLPLSFHVQQSNTGINQIEEEKNVLVILVVLFPNCHSGPHGMRLVWFQDKPDHRPVCLSQGHATNHGGTQKEQARDIGTRQSWGEWFQSNPYQIVIFIILTKRLNLMLSFFLKALFYEKMTINSRSMKWTEIEISESIFVCL